ncbi:MAG: class I SAM-dependent methyltransferase [Thermoleophilia bacterium]|nr:class I SAM-dependent methyltransferase [Thermoleophilia bacterium]
MPSNPSPRPLSGKATRAANRAARRLAGTALGKRAVTSLRTEPAPARLDDWLVPLFGGELDRIETAVKDAGPEGYREFRSLDDDLWSMLLTLDYDAYPGIRSYLPDLPEPTLQEMWNGTSGPALAAQSVCFYRKLKEMQAAHGTADLSGSRTLDFGCGWGRLTRMLAKDLDPGLLHGCDPVESILDVSRETHVPAELARSEFLPETLPFDGKFDLIFSFSVFTHISEKAHLASLGAIHEGLNPGGIFVVTIRPPAYINVNPLMQPAVDRLGPDRLKVLRDPQYVFVPHETEGHPQFGGEEMHYGEAVVTLPYVREKWSSMFDLLDVSILSGDMYQVALTLRRR